MNRGIIWFCGNLGEEKFKNRRDLSIFKCWLGTCRKGENENTEKKRHKYIGPKKVGEVGSRTFKGRTDF